MSDMTIHIMVNRYGDHGMKAKTVKFKDLPKSTIITGLILHIPKRYMLEQGIPKSKMLILSGWFKGLWLKTDNNTQRMYPLTLHGESFDEINDWKVTIPGG